MLLTRNYWNPATGRHRSLQQTKCRTVRLPSINQVESSIRHWVIGSVIQWVSKSVSQRGYLLSMGPVFNHRVSQTRRPFRKSIMYSYLAYLLHYQGLRNYFEIKKRLASFLEKPCALSIWTLFYFVSNSKKKKKQIKTSQKGLYTWLPYVSEFVRKWVSEWWKGWPTESEHNKALQSNN